MERKIEIRPGRTINVYIHQHPSNDATAFLIHGLGGSSRQWREQIEFLKPNYTVVAPDLLGHGQSDRPKTEHAYSFSELDLDLQTLFNHFSSDTNIILGHSYGCALAASVALDHQDRVNKLILISPLPCSPNVSMPLIYHLPVFILDMLRPLLEKQFQTLAFDKTTDPQLLAIELQAGRENSLYVIKNTIKGMQDMPTIDLTMLTVPTLIITSDHDGIVPTATQQKFYLALPHHQLVEINNTAHMCMLEKPEEVNKAIEGFLTSVVPT